MDLTDSCCWKQLLLVSFLLDFVNGQTSGPYFTVTFPAVIESGSEARLCASLLKPNESLVMNIYVVEFDQSTLLLQEKAEEEFHRCFNFKAPSQYGFSAPTMKVEIEGASFKMTEERAVMFKHYHPLNFIQTDKPIYTPGQTVNFRIVSMDTSFVPFDQQYSGVLLEDSKGNKIGQWRNVSSTRWILQLSYELNAEARQGIYKIKAFAGDRMISHDFEVKKYVLPKFEITVTVPKTVRRGAKFIAVEVCGKYTYRQPVSGKSRVKVCRDYSCCSQMCNKYSPICVNETTEIKKTGCAMHTLNISAFLNPSYCYRVTNSFNVEATVTEEGTEITMTKSETISLTKGIETSSRDKKTVQEIQPPYSLFLNELIIENIEQPLKCDAEFTLTIKYYFLRETVEEFKTDIVYMALSRGVIVRHGYKKVEVKTSNGEANGTVSFKLSVGGDLAPVVHFQAYCVLPSENVVAGGRTFNTEKCFKNKVSLQFSPAKAVPGETNTLQISAQPGSLCGLSAVDQSVLIMESGKRLDTDKIFNLLPVHSVSDYPKSVEDMPECPAMLYSGLDNAFKSFKVTSRSYK